MNKFKVGDIIPVSAILTITGVQPTKNGSARYNTDHGINLSETILDQITIKGKPTAVKAVEPQDKPEPKDTTVERLELVSEICGMGMCRSASKRKNQCPIYGIRRERISCADYVIAHPETQKIMEDYLAAERAPEQPKGWNGEAICTADGSRFTGGKKYTFINGVVRDDNGDYRPCGGNEHVHSTSENWFANKFIEYRGEAK